MSTSHSTPDRLKELALVMIDYNQSKESREEAVNTVIDIWEKAKTKEGLTTSLSFKEGWANIHECMTFQLIGSRGLTDDEEKNLTLWKRMVKQIIRHDGMEPLYNMLRNREKFNPTHLDFLLEQGLDLFSPQRQMALDSVAVCKSKTFFPQLQHFIEEGKIDLLARSTRASEFGNVGGFLLRESTHLNYVKAVLETGIHPDELWTAPSYISQPNQAKEYLCASAFQYLCNEFAGNFEYQFSTGWQEDWYQLRIDILTLLLEYGADYHYTHPLSPNAYPTAIQALDSALASIEGKKFDSKWIPCVEATKALRTQFYDHSLHQKLSQESQKHLDEHKASKLRI